MSQAPDLPGTIEPGEFVRLQEVREGDVPLTALSRLADLLARTDGGVRVVLSGRHGRRGEPLLSLAVEGELWLTCQRCLKPVAWAVKVAAAFELRSDVSQLTQADLEDDSRDFLSATETVSVVALIEDELLLNLPLVPRHEHCEAPGAGKAKGPASPFSALAALKKRMH